MITKQALMELKERRSNLERELAGLKQQIRSGEFIHWLDDEDRCRADAWAIFPMLGYLLSLTLTGPLSLFAMAYVYWRRRRQHNPGRFWRYFAGEPWFL